MSSGGDRDVGEPCSWNWQCGNQACGRPHATDAKECCDTGSVCSFLGFDWCSGYGPREVCKHDCQCDPHTTDGICSEGKCGCPRGKWLCFDGTCQTQCCPPELTLCDDGTCKTKCCPAGLKLCNDDTCQTQCCPANPNQALCGPDLRSCCCLYDNKVFPECTKCKPGFTGEQCSDCEDGRLNCFGVCKDVLTDNEHCGGCVASPCTGTDVCVGGVCVEGYNNIITITECDYHYEFGNYLRTTFNVNSNDDFCKTQLPFVLPVMSVANARVAFTNLTNMGAIYKVDNDKSCNIGEYKCGDRCVTDLTGPSNCGRCGTACDSSEICDSEGVCACESKNQTNCGSGCVDLNTVEHCGKCDTLCDVAGGETCKDAGCTCKNETQQNCGAGCVDLNTVENCGKCGTACDVAGGEICGGEKCECADENKKNCEGKGCISVRTVDNCGTCGNSCDTQAGEVCKGTACACEDPHKQKIVDATTGGECVTCMYDDDTCYYLKLNSVAQAQTRWTVNYDAIVPAGYECKIHVIYYNSNAHDVFNIENVNYVKNYTQEVTIYDWVDTREIFMQLTKDDKIVYTTPSQYICESSKFDPNDGCNSCIDPKLSKCGHNCIIADLSSDPDHCGVACIQCVGLCVNGGCADPIVEIKNIDRLNHTLDYNIEYNLDGYFRIHCYLQEVGNDWYSDKVYFKDRAFGTISYNAQAKSVELIVFNNNNVDITRTVLQLLCPSGQLDCGNGCIDVTSDIAHCGTCRPCNDATFLCDKGSCVCPSGKFVYNGTCVEPALVISRAESTESGLGFTFTLILNTGVVYTRYLLKYNNGNENFIDGGVLSSASYVNNNVFLDSVVSVKSLTIFIYDNNNRSVLLLSKTACINVYDQFNSQTGECECVSTDDRGKCVYGNIERAFYNANSQNVEIKYTLIMPDNYTSIITIVDSGKKKIITNVSAGLSLTNVVPIDFVPRAAWLEIKNEVGSTAFKSGYMCTGPASDTCTGANPKDEFQCFDFSNTAEHCGSCANACPSNQLCKNSSCVVGCRGDIIQGVCYSLKILAGNITHLDTHSVSMDITFSIITKTGTCKISVYLNNSYGVDIEEYIDNNNLTATRHITYKDNNVDFTALDLYVTASFYIYIYNEQDGTYTPWRITSLPYTLT